MLYERLDDLEALAASAVQSRAIEKTSAAGKASSKSVTMQGYIIAQSLPADDASDISMSNSSAALRKYVNKLFRIQLTHRQH